MKNTFSIAIVLVLLVGCAERKARLWIDPPLGYDPGKSPRNLVYKVEDIESGKRESVMIPVTQVPKNLVLEGGPKSSSSSELEAATKADQYIRDGKLPSADKAGRASVSYLKGLEQVQNLYAQKSFHEALITLAPLLEQYPDRAKLFTMQGTLYRKLGEKKLAYQSFKRSLQLDASNASVEEAAAGLAAEIGEER